ncbi:hypothetical protein GXW82_37260 [Streptacidiphilus sp. 4-A2]|nr:hypothetical protein [Streptacidiphilus sp. 4-A2]
MTWHRSAHQADAERDPGTEAPVGGGGAARPDPHTAELILAAVATEGLPALTRVMLAARNGDRDAAGMRVGALLRALSGTSWFTAHDLLSNAGVQETTTVGELDQTQRSTLSRSLSRILESSAEQAPGRAATAQ